MTKFRIVVSSVLAVVGGVLGWSGMAPAAPRQPAGLTDSHGEGQHDAQLSALIDGLTAEPRRLVRTPGGSSVEGGSLRATQIAQHNVS